MREKLPSIFIRLCIMLTFFISMSGYSQMQTQPKPGETLKGNVIDEKGGPLVGVSVLLKGTAKGTTTDANGNFILNLPSGSNQILTFSFIGYQAHEVLVGTTTFFKVQLKPQQGNLNEVVVIGYGAVKRRDLTGSVSSVSAADLKDIPVNSAAQALAGRLAGVQVTTPEGGPGTDSRIVIRGGGSITQDNSPLYIIDGIQVESGLGTLSPQDIQSVDVLKDASATAIYGARGANGVIIITTKGGREMPTEVNYNGFYGLNALSKKLSVMNVHDYLRYEWERTRGNGSDSAGFRRMYGSTWDTLNVYNNRPTIDWQQEVFGRKAPMQTHNLSVVGGSKTTTFNISLTKNLEQGIMLTSDFDRNLLNFRFDHTVNKRLKIGINTRYLDQTLNGRGTSAGGTAQTSTLREAVRYQPLITKANQSIDQFDSDYYNLMNGAGNAVALINPIALTHAQYRKANTYDLTMGTVINYQFTKFLTLTTTASYNLNNYRIDLFEDAITPNAFINGNGQPIATVTAAQRKTTNLSNVINFSNASFKGQFNRDNSFNLLLGQEIYAVSTRQSNSIFRLFPIGISPDKALGQLNLGTVRPGYPITLDVDSRIASFFGRGSYSYKGKYLATFTLRADGSTKFAEDHRWGYFPSGALAWKVSEESFMKKVDLVSDVKLRLSYGESGNNRIGDFLYTSNFITTAFPYGLSEQIVPSYTAPTLANSRLKWERTVAKNIGLDFGLFKNRIQMTIDAYQNDVKDLLINVPIPASSGYVNQLQNVGSTRNRGIEFQVNAKVMNTKDFSWGTNFNISFNRNKILSLSTYQNSYTQWSGWGVPNSLDDYMVKVGAPVGAMYGFVTDGFYKLSDFDYNTTTHIYTLKPGVPTDVTVMGIPQPGSIKLKDLNGDGKVDATNDRQIIGDATPKFIGGINQTFRYKNFDMSIFANFVYGNKIMNANKIEFTNAFSPFQNLSTEMNNRWRTVDGNGNVLQSVVTVGGTQVVTGQAPDVIAAANQNATIWQPIRGAAGAFAVHSWAIEDGSFLRINNITMGYSLPSAMLSRYKIKGLRFYATVNNVALITNYSGFDPEVNITGSNPVTQGVDYAAYPRSRTFILGLNVKL